MNTWLIADTHFCCERLVKNTRPCFPDITTHDCWLMANINSMVGVRDRLYIIGDFCYRPNNVMSYRKLIKCKDIWLIMGNHDKRSTCELAFGKDLVRDSITIKHGPPEDRKLVYLQHFPVAYWDKSHYGSYHAYGHTHSQREDQLDLAFPQRRSKDVGVDQVYKDHGYYGPISVETFLDSLKDRAGHDFVNPNQRWKDGMT